MQQFEAKKQLSKPLDFGGFVATNWSIWYATNASRWFKDSLFLFGFADLLYAFLNCVIVSYTRASEQTNEHDEGIKA